jgi:protein-disulfide isomerase
MKKQIAAALLLIALPLAAAAQQFGPAQFPIKADNGDILTNHVVSAEHAAELERLPGIVITGNPKGDVTLYQFYDLNCGFCRQAAADIDDIMRKDRNLRMVFVPYPTLSTQSVEGARVELAVREIATPERWLEFRKKVYAGRGIIDGARAIAVAQEMKLDLKKIIEIANAKRTTDTMVAHAKLGSTLKLVATPAYVIGGVAVVGHPDREPLRKLVASVRACKKVVCS